MNTTANITIGASTLLVLRHSNNAIGIVQAVGKDRNLIDVQPDCNKVDTVLRIDSSESSFMDFYADFYHQLKDPSDFSFFKVTEFEVEETARDLQAYINNLSDFEKESLKDYEVSIEAVNTIRNKRSLKRGSSVLQSGGLTNESADLQNWSNDKSTIILNDVNQQSSALSANFNGQSSVVKDMSQYRYHLADIDWAVMAEMGLNMEILEKIGALNSLLKGYKTPMLIPILFNDGKAVSTVDARLQLRIDDDGELAVRVHRVCKRVDFRKKFKGHRFTKEDRNNLLSSENMGRVVDLIDMVTGEVIPSLVSLDKLTNELISLRTDFVRIPDVLCGVTLTLEQKEILRAGKPLFVEDMVSKKNSLFSATVQFNADRQWVAFLFESNLKGVQQNFKGGVPAVFRGVKLRHWQLDKLKAGETAYIKGMESKKGKIYQDYIQFDKATGRIEFSFKNPKKK